MGLETGTYINDLNESWPVGDTDPKAQGDDHLRLIKKVIKNTFPNITGPITIDQSVLNILNPTGSPLPSSGGYLTIEGSPRTLVWKTGTTGDILYWNGSAWTSLATGTSGQILSTTGSAPQWVASSTSSLEGLSDTNIGSPATSDVLAWNGTKWAPETGILRNVVEDTSPQLGSHLDTNGFELRATGTDNLVLRTAGTGNVLLDPDATGYVSFEGQILPTTIGTAGQVLTVSASPATGQLIWADAAGGGGSVTNPLTANLDTGGFTLFNSNTYLDLNEGSLTLLQTLAASSSIKLKTNDTTSEVLIESAGDVGIEGGFGGGTGTVLITSGNNQLDMRANGVNNDITMTNNSSGDIILDATAGVLRLDGNVSSIDVGANIDINLGSPVSGVFNINTVSWPQTLPSTGQILKATSSTSLDWATDSASPNIVGGTGITVTEGSPQFTVALTSTNISQFTNDSGYLTAIPGSPQVIYANDNISLLTNDANYITAADLPPTGSPASHVEKLELSSIVGSPAGTYTISSADFDKKNETYATTIVVPGGVLETGRTVNLWLNSTAVVNPGTGSPNLDFAAGAGSPNDTIAKGWLTLYNTGTSVKVQ